MAAGTVNDVKAYAPEGYRLERTDYEGGAAHHRFVCEGKPELVCTVGAHEDERGVLEKFQAALAPKLAVTEPGTPAVAVVKPAKRRG